MGECCLRFIPIHVQQTLANKQTVVKHQAVLRWYTLCDTDTPTRMFQDGGCDRRKGLRKMLSANVYGSPSWPHKEPYGSVSIIIISISIINNNIMGPLVRQWWVQGFRSPMCITNVHHQSATIIMIEQRGKLSLSTTPTVLPAGNRRSSHSPTSINALPAIANNVLPFLC